MTRSTQHDQRQIGGAALPGAAPRRHAEWICLAMVLAATFVVYRPAMRGSMLFDDDFYLTRPDLQSADGLFRIWFDPTATAQYYPLVHTIFWLEHKLLGDQFLDYHLANVVWHSLAVLLVYVVLVKLEIPGAFVAAAIFALHPVVVESVAWMTEQKNTLSTVFYLCATWAYLQFDNSRRRSHYLLGLVLFAAALLTKTATVTLPVALLIILWWQHGALSWRRDVGSLLPFFALSIAAGCMTIWVERIHGAQGADFSLTFVERTLVAGRAIWFYLAKLVWPNNLTFFYPRWTIDPAQWWQWICPIAALATTVALWAMRGRSRAPLAAWLYFCGTLFPVLGFLNVYYFRYSFVADHFQYLASLGIITFVAAGISQGLAQLKIPARYVGDALCGVLLATLAAMSLRQSPMYADIVTLYETTIERNSGCWLAHTNLGKILADAGNQAEAIAHYELAIQIKPDYGDAHNNLANTFTHAGRLTDALKESRIAISLNAKDPAYHSNMASTLVKLGQYPEAIDQCREALRLDPNRFDARLNLGASLLHAGRLPEAVDEIRAAQVLRPDDPIVCNTLGGTLAQLGQYPEAIEQTEHALQLRPDFAEAHNNLAQALARSGQTPQAIEHFHRAMALDENFAAANIGLGLVLAAQDKHEDAIKQFEKAIQVGANEPDVHNYLGDSFRKSGQTDRAIEHYQTAVRLKPDFMPACANLAQTLALVNRPQEAIAVAEKAMEIARSTGQQDELGQFEEWLKHYRTELRRAEEAKPAPSPPAKP